MSALLLPVAYSPSQTSVTQTFTFTTSQTVTSVNIVVSSYTQTQTVPGAGPPPFITVSNIQWNNKSSPPVLSFYMQNSGGSGTVTLAIFADGYSGTQSFHIDALSATTFTLNFPDYNGATPPMIRVVQQTPDSGPIPQPVVISTTQTNSLYFTNAITILITQVSTIPYTPTSSQSNPAPSPQFDLSSLALLILPLAAVVLVALLLLSRRRSQAGPASAHRFCGQCGKPIQAGSAFCSECGASTKK